VTFRGGSPVDRKPSLYDRQAGDDYDDDLDRVSDLPSLPGSRKTSEQMRKLSGRSYLFY
jgi:hypothetical protein